MQMFLSYQTRVFLVNSDVNVFEVLDSSYVMWIKQAGNY